jgi:hypothetical protein
MACTQRFTDKQIVAALTKTKGMVFLAAKRLGYNPDTIYERAKSCEAIRDAIRHQRGKLIDTAESKLHAAVNRGEPWAIQMCLKTIGKDRGFVERQEHTGKDGEPLPTPVIRLAPSPERVSVNGSH